MTNICKHTFISIDREGAKSAVFHCEVPVDHTLEDVKDPAYFGGIAGRDEELRPGDYIEVRPQDYAWHLRVMIRAVLVNEARVFTAVLEEVDFRDPEAQELPEGWEIKWTGEQSLHAIHGPAGLIESGLVTREAAYQRALKLIPSMTEPEPKTPARKPAAKKAA